MTPETPQREALLLFFKKTLIVFGVALLLALLFFVRRVVVILFIAGVLAAGISPAVHRVRVWVRLYTRRKIRRGTAVILVYIPFLVLAILLAVFAVPAILVETREMTERLPELIETQILRPLGEFIPTEPIREWLAVRPGELELFPYIRGAVTLIASTVAVLFLIVYMMIDADRLRNMFLLFYPPEQRTAKRKMILRLSRRMSSWLSGQLILAMIVGGATLVGLLALRIPYALPLALLAAVGELVPVIGPILGAIPAVMVALLQSPWQFWAVLALAILIQQVENYLLVPRLMGHRVSVSPLAVFTAFLIGGSLLGIIGAILAIPVTAIVQVTFEEAFLMNRERRLDRTRPGTLVRRGS